MSEPEIVRTRIAPSPTGLPHIGNFRTIVFNWLFARHHGGKFVVRIEDTDVARRVEGAMEAMLDGLRWLGLDWDEGPEVGGPHGPYLQSQRLPIYKEHADRLIAQGDAYYCFCSPERLAAMRQEQQQRKEPPGYDRLCRGLTEAEVRANAHETTLRSLKEFFVLARIAEAEGITVEDEDLEMELEALAERRGESVRRLRARAEKEGLADALATQILERKALDRILKSVEIEDIPLDEPEPVVETLDQSATPAVAEEPAEE
jgi:hypothetical protein